MSYKTYPYKAINGKVVSYDKHLLQSHMLQANMIKSVKSFMHYVEPLMESPQHAILLTWTEHLKSVPAKLLDI